MRERGAERRADYLQAAETRAEGLEGAETKGDIDLEILRQTLIRPNFR